MSETFFSLNDLLRRKLQTGLVVFGMALCVASTLFLLLLSDKIGFGVLSIIENRLTASFLTIFSRFIMFVGFLIFVVGMVIISFLVFIMMSQRIRDIGLMKAAGCPNNLVFGYFMNELIMVAFVGCLLGVVLGIVGDYASTSLLNSMGFQATQGSATLWLTLIIFALFFVLSLIIGAKPILDTAKVKPAMALSPSFSYGLSKESDFKGVSKAGLTVKMAVRSLFRRKSATFRIILCLTVVFILVTVSVAGGIVADRTTKSWVERAVGRDMVLVGHHDMCNSYELLLSKFHETKTSTPINYSDKRYVISDKILGQLESMPELSIDPRLIMEAQIEEVQGIVYGQQTGETTVVGDNRKDTSLIVGIEPKRALSQWFLDGEFLTENQTSEAMIGDTIAQKIFTNPLVQNLTLFENDFAIKGVCLDPINNGNVTYVPLATLQSISNISKPNVIMVRISATANRQESLDRIRTAVKAADSEFEVLELNEVLDKSLNFLGYIWSTIMFLPLLSLSAAILCLVGYVILSINEQRQEFGILRAVGAKPRLVLKIVLVQNLLVLLSSWAAGIALGIMVTLLILIPEPFVTGYTVAEIAAWLFIAFAAIFAFSLYPALRFARKPILESLAQP
jgi:ABC-type antimicrobial peptide transport system permease subunit